jgi:DNA-binding SARP family transcriptional activator
MNVELQVHAPTVVETTTETLTLSLLQRFALRDQRESICLPLVAQRLIAFLALHDRPQSRFHVAGVLWPDADDHHASANLRSTLWRVNRVGFPMFASADGDLRLRPDVTVDVRSAYVLARQILDPASPPEDPPFGSTSCLGEDILPDWCEDWVLIERERFRQVRLHALEALCLNLADGGFMTQAIEAGLAAIAGEPLRESAYRALISVHLQEGNRVEAMRQFAACKKVLWDELGVEPSAELSKMLGDHPG